MECPELDQKLQGPISIQNSKKTKDKKNISDNQSGYLTTQALGKIRIPTTNKQNKKNSVKILEKNPELSNVICELTPTQFQFQFQNRIEFFKAFASIELKFNFNFF